jgi:hypothetical protein
VTAINSPYFLNALGQLALQLGTGSELVAQTA